MTSQRKIASCNTELTGCLLKANGCADLHGNEVLCFPQKFKNTLEELGKKGYRLKEASVNFIVYWKRQDDKLEVKIVLPKIIVEKE